MGKKICIDPLLTCEVLTSKVALKLKIVDSVIYNEVPMYAAIEWLSAKIRGESNVVQAIKRINTCSSQLTSMFLKEILLLRYGVVLFMLTLWDQCYHHLPLLKKVIKNQLPNVKFL